MSTQFTKAVKYGAKLRMALIGPAGSGKTFSALNIAQHLGKKVALIDTEHGSASKYADQFSFDTMEPATFSPQVYIEAIKAAQAAGYDVLIIDSLSHAWMGKEGTLELVDRAAKKSQSSNTFAAWRDVTPLHNQLVETMLACNLHLIVTMRSKMEYAVEKDEKAGKTTVKKIGLAPVQRDGLEYEFDVTADMTLDNDLIVSKTRCPALKGNLIPTPGKETADILLAWLAGEPAPEPPPEPPPPAQPAAGNANGNGKPAPASKATRASVTPERLKELIDKKVAGYAERWGLEELATQDQRGLIVSKLEEVWPGGEWATENRWAVLNYLTGNASSKLLTKAQAAALLDWLVNEKDDSGDYPLNAAACSEAQAIVRLLQEQAGQQALPLDGAE